jgi:hypothetical protein
MNTPRHLRPAAAALLAIACILPAAHAAPPAADAAPRPAARRDVERAPAAPTAASGPIVTEVASGGITVTRRIDAPTGWQPGAPLALRIDARGDRVEAVDVPALAKGAGPFEASSARAVRGAAPGTAGVESTLVTWDAGDLALPAMHALVRRADGTVTDVELPATTVHVDSLVGDALPLTELAHGLRDPVDIPTGAWKRWAVAIAGVVLCLGFVLWLMRRRSAAPLAPPLPPDEWALREIDRLESERLPERGEVDGFFVRLSDVVRTYIERRFGIAAPEQTTQEFIRAAGGHPDLAGGHERTLAQFLRTADMVKFAAQRPAGTECGRALDAMRGFVRATAPIEAPVDHAVTPAEPPVARAAARDAAREARP